MNLFKISLTKRYIPAVLLIAIFVISSHILISKVVSSNSEFAKIINISGKQRMLSQRLIILGKNYYENFYKKSNDKLLLEKALKEIKTAHQFLLTKIITQELDEIYFKKSLDDNLKKYLKNFDNLLIVNNPIFLKLARENSTKILVQLDQVVKEYERYANKELQTTSQYEFYIMMLTLLILSMEVIL